MANKMYVKEGVGFEGISMMQEQKSNPWKRVMLAIIFLAIVGSIGYGVSKLFISSEEEQPQTPAVTILPTSSRQTEPTDTPEPTAELKATATPTKKVTPTVAASPTKKITPTAGTAKTSAAATIIVLNGSGTKGAAKGMSDDLIAAGYTVVRTGNADSFTYEGISVNVKKSKKQMLDQLKKDLSASGYLISSSTMTLDETETADAVVIVGSE